jgi:hypothetical protein
MVAEVNNAPARKKGWLRFTRPHAENPMLDNVLTALVVSMIAGKKGGLNEPADFACRGVARNITDGTGSNLLASPT